MTQLLILMAQRGLRGHDFVSKSKCIGPIDFWFHDNYVIRMLVISISDKLAFAIGGSGISIG